MQYPCYNNSNTPLTEGSWFLFRVHNLLQLQDNEWYYVLEDINGLRHFISAEHYKMYGFEPGDYINCKIDKINCTGRMFLEPRHPHYNEGETYSFEQIEFPIKDNLNIIFIRDILGNNIEVPLNPDKKFDANEVKNVKCIVKGIKKGKPILEISSI